jgi:hypothetical protein
MLSAAGVFLWSASVVVFVSVFLSGGVLLVSRACSLDGDVLGLILGGMTAVIGFLGATTVYKLIMVDNTREK